MGRLLVRSLALPESVSKCPSPPDCSWWLYHQHMKVMCVNALAWQALPTDVNDCRKALWAPFTLNVKMHHLAFHTNTHTEQHSAQTPGDSSKAACLMWRLVHCRGARLKHTNRCTRSNKAMLQQSFWSKCDLGSRKQPPAVRSNTYTHTHRNTYTWTQTLHLF